MSREATQGIDYTSRDYESIRADMITTLKKKMPEYTDTSETDMGIVLLELLAMGFDILSFYQDKQANEALLTTCDLRESALKWVRMFGYTPQHTTPSKAYQVFVLQNKLDVDTPIKKGTVVRVPATSTAQSIGFTTEADLTIPAGCLGNEKNSDGTYKYQVSVIQGLQISNEFLGTSTGVQNQKFNLNYYPVVTDSVELYVKEDSNAEWVLWNMVSNFMDSNMSSQDYVLNILDSNIAQVLFGDGTTGKIPAQFQNGLKVNYMMGGGTVGNVTSNTITELVTPIPVIDSTFNPEAVYIKGKDKESLSSIKVNAPAYNLVRWGAFNLEDHEKLVKQLFSDVLYVKAKKDPENPDNLFLYIMLNDNAVLTKERKQTMLNTLQDRLIVGVGVLSIFSMNLYPIDFVCALLVADNYKKDTVTQEVTTYINNYFAFGNLDTSEDVSVTYLESLVQQNVKGIKSFRVMSPTDLVISVPEGQVASVNSLSINASGGV